MAGNQLGFDYYSDKDFGNLLNEVVARLNRYFDKYELQNKDIVYVQISFRLLNKLIFSDLFIDKDKLENLPIANCEKKSTQDLVKIPSIVEQDILGKPLVTVLDSNNNIKQINVIIKGVKLNFINTIIEKTKYINSKNAHFITSFDSKYKFYYIKSDIDYILAIKEWDNRVDKIKYFISGNILHKITDTRVGDMLIRNNGSENIYIKNNVLVKSSNNINFIPIEKYKIKKPYWQPNTNIGAIDVETFIKYNDVCEIYALGFKTKLSSEPVIYYINKDYNSNILVLTMID